MKRDNYIQLITDDWKERAKHRENHGLIKVEIDKFSDLHGGFINIPLPHRNDIGGLIDFMNGN